MKSQLQVFFLLSIFILITGCSTMGKVAKVTFLSAKEMYAVQPKVVKDNHPFFVKKTFYTAELLTTDYTDWKIRVVSKESIDDFIAENTVDVELRYEVNYDSFSKKVPLVYLSKNTIKNDDELLYAYDFAFSSEGLAFWQKYNEHLFEFDKPWFIYQISPELPLHVKTKIKEINYNYAPNWGYLNLRELMELFDLNTDKRWENFCFWRMYSYDDSSVCGDIEVDDSIQRTIKVSEDDE